MGDDEMRRLLVLLAVIAGLSIAATPILAAETFHYRERGSGVSAWFSNVETDADGMVLPGSYVETWVDGSTWVARGDSAWEYEYACVGAWSFTVTPEGEWIDEGGFGYCGEADVMTLSKKLGGGQLTASFEVEDCLAWDEETGECLDAVVIGTVAVDLAFSGVGALERYHGTSSGGTAGQAQYTSHGNGVQRAADVSGTVTLDGASLIDEATESGAWLFQTKSGYMEVWH
jgi:hypothetical protein